MTMGTSNVTATTSGDSLRFQVYMSSDTERNLSLFCNLQHIVGEVVGVFDVMHDSWTFTLSPLQAAHILCSLAHRMVGQEHPALYRDFYRPVLEAMQAAQVSSLQLDLMELLDRATQPVEGFYL